MLRDHFKIYFLAGLLASSFVSNCHAWDAPTYGDTSISMADTLIFGGENNGLSNQQLGDWVINAALTGVTGTQSNSSNNEPRSFGDLSNGQVIIAKPSGLLQFFAVAGYYSMPDLATNYLRAATQTRETWGALPVAFATIAPNANWSMNAGNLFALGGAEGTFTYENINIQRGLLWGQTNSVSQGVQLNYQNDALTTSVAWTDGAYSGTFNWLAISTGYKLSTRSTVTAIWNGSLSTNSANSLRTPLLQNNSQITNLLFSYKGESWGLTPYLQYSVVPANPSIGISGVSSSQGIGLLATYRISPLIDGQPAKRNVSLPFRLEFINTTGNSGTSQNNLLYGPNSAAWSITITPTIQRGMFFGRIEASLVNALNSQPGAAFGSTGNSPRQTRAMLEAGILF